MTLPSLHFRPQGDDIVHRFTNLRVSIGANKGKIARVLRKIFQSEVAGYDFAPWHDHCQFPARRTHEEGIRNHHNHGDSDGDGCANFLARSELPLIFNISTVSNTS